MAVELRTILFGMTCGLTAGFSPGPLLALVVSQTLKYNFSEGVKVAMAPVFTDLPIIAVALFLLSKVGDITFLLGCISLIGAAVVAYVGVGNFKAQTITIDYEHAIQPKSFLQGIATNFFQPHPHIFWFGIGAPAILLAWKTSHLAAFGYLIAFFTGIIGAKVFVAYLVKRSKGVVPQHFYQTILRTLGAVLLFFSVLLLRDGLKYFGFNI